MKNPKYRYIFSVIVPTYNRVDELKELLFSLEQQTLSQDLFEVIIVDDGSEDSTSDLVEQFSAKGNLNITFLKQNHQGPGPARNLGMNKAAGNFFVFIDSDCIADKNWLQAYAKKLETVLPAGFGGPDKVLPDFLPVQKAIDYSMTSFITTGGIRGHSKKKISKYFPRSFNMGVRADIIDEIGGMGNLRHGQDIEFSNRIIKTGQPVIKVDDAIVYHKRRIGIKKFFKQVFNWGVARINLFKLDSNMLELIHILPAIATIISMLIILMAVIIPNIFIPILIVGIGILVSMSIHAAIKYKDIRVLPYIPIIVPIQIWGYGFGFIYAFFKRIILKKDKLTGFTKNYYK